MLIRKVILENFGLFRGRNEIELAPKSRNGRPKPVVLVGGKNGAGKTTLLEALRLCLYGPFALGARVSNGAYERYLRNRVHRDEGALIQLEGALVGMQFDYSQCGERHVYDIERSWDVQKGNVTSHLTVLRDGKPLDDLDRENADEFLRDLIPPGVSDLYFFDGEKIQELADTEADDATVADSIRSLLGLDLVERLQSDLRIYASRLKDDQSGVEPVQAKIAEIEKERKQLEKERKTAQALVDKGGSRTKTLRKDVVRHERRIASEGGKYASRYESLKAEKKQLLQSITDAEEEIRGLCEGLLPFSLCTALCKSLQEQLQSEAAVQAWESQERLLSERLDAARSSLDEYLFPPQSRFAKSTRDQMIKRVSSLLDGLAEVPNELPSISLTHRLSDGQRVRLAGGIDRVFSDLPRQIRSAHTRLEKATRRLGKVEASLGKVPEEDQLQPVVERLSQIQRKLADASAELDRNETELKRIDFRIKELAREDRNTVAKLAKAERGVSRTVMVARVRGVLDEYSSALGAQKARQLSDAVARRFAQLWRKGDLIQRIEIDPNSFKVQLFDRHDRKVPKKQLSAGEKQIYAISMLWGLAEISGRPLPMVIDTPLGRLDSEHRGHLVERYFPHASHQVIILSTDTEIDQTYFEDLHPDVSHTYHLRYDPQEARSLVEKGYFWKKRKRELTHADK